MSHPARPNDAVKNSALLDNLRQTHAKRRPMPLKEKPSPAKNAGAYDFSRHPAYGEVKIAKAAAETLSLGSPFFRVTDDVRSTALHIDGTWLSNFASYDYLSLNLSDAVRSAAAQAVSEFGVSATASRLVGGERSLHKTLETKISDFMGTKASLVLVSGHATNMAIIRTLLGAGDLIVVDALAHNSIYEGVLASGAAHVTFPHNDFDWVERYLERVRLDFKNVLIVVEGLYSMDGDTPDLKRAVDLKDHNGAWLMVDEAHSIGVLGATGRGICEEQGVDPNRIEIIMGTLSKSFCSCGGFVTGSEALIDLMRYKAPGFVFSVGLSTPNTAAAIAAIETISAEPERVQRLREVGKEFVSIARELDLDTGDSEGFAVCPVIIGDSLKAVWIANQLMSRGFNVLPIIAPAVPNQSARLRFFLNHDHTASMMRAVLKETRDLVDQVKTLSVVDMGTG